MRSKRRTGLGVGVERLEGRLVMSQGGVGHWLQGFVFSTPGAALTIPGSYDPSARTTVEFVTRGGATTSEPALSNTAGHLTAAVPLLLNPKTLQPMNQGVHVFVVQTTATTTTQTAAIYHLQITPRPLRGVGVGVATELGLMAAEAHLVAAEQSYAQIIAANPNATAAISLQGQVDSVLQASQTLLAQIDPLVRGNVSSVAAGSIAGHPVTLTRNTLALLDPTLAQASIAPTTPFSTQDDVVTNVTNSAVRTVEGATNNLATIQPGQAAGANLIGGFAGLGASLAQIDLYAASQARASAELAAAVANPALVDSAMAAVTDTLNTVQTSSTASSLNDLPGFYSQTIFAAPLQIVLQQEGNAPTDLATLEVQLFGFAPPQG